MGFTKSRGVDQFKIGRKFPCASNEGHIEYITVFHTFRLPTAEERDEYEQKALHMRGKKLTHKVSTAKIWLWNRCCVSVEGYDDLPKDEKGNLDPQWKQKYFANDPKVLLHCDQFTSDFLDILEGEQTELEKN
ncbi:MAG: hypothetical protein DRP74_08010 [Candidatus Omnitrophota bacterium]|nr:MAG: hypothetical protein DRP74_08010 [Candidatus Omnitrophota bacterium]